MTALYSEHLFVIIGTSGGVGSGKSTAAGMIAEALKGEHINADTIVSNLLQCNKVVKKVGDKFGPAYIGKQEQLDRKAIASDILSNKTKRKQLENILHPLVRSEIKKILSENQRSYYIFDIPLLHEGGLASACDFIVFIETPKELRSQRARERHGWSKEEWENREKMQWNISSKRSEADVIISNESSLDAMTEQIEQLVPRLKKIKPRSLSVRLPHL